MFKLVYKPVFFILIITSFAAFSSARDIRRPPKELPEHLVKLQDNLIEDVNKIEKVIYERGALYYNKDVERYINKVGEKITPETELDEKVEFKFKIIRDPAVNAFALPNGSIYIHTGALARLKNEAQLAFLLGHEMSHVVHRDGVYHTNSVHNKTVAFKLIDIALAPTSVFFGILGDLAQLGFGILHISTVTGYSRAVETRADEDGITWSIEKGYHPEKAQGVLNIFLQEKEKYQVGPEIYFLMNHPSNEYRLKRIKRIIEKEYGDDAEGEAKEAEFLNNMTEVKLYNATLNIKMDRLEHAMDNIQWVLDKFPNNPRAHYLSGEINRLKAEDKKKLSYELNYNKWRELNKDREEGELEELWRNKAIEEHNLALEGEYCDSYKGLGLLYYGIDDYDKAELNLGKYLAAKTDAMDKRYVSSLLKSIEKRRGENEVQ